MLTKKKRAVKKNDNRSKAGKARTKNYVGITHDGTCKVFKCFYSPTAKTHGKTYKSVFGPFDTLAGARYFASHPKCPSIKAAESAAKRKRNSCK